MNPFLSIIIPVYNGERYLPDTIASVLQQPCKDFELLLFDDGSTDQSAELISKLINEMPKTGDCYKNYPEIKLIRQQNQGVSRTRNSGIEMARGEVIIFIDQDDAMRSDFYTSDMRERLHARFSEEIDLILCGTWYCDENLKLGHYNAIEPRRKGVYPGHENDISWQSTWCFNANIFSRRLFFNENGTPTPIRFFDLPLDVETIFRHISQYGARKLLFSDDYSFCCRRVNSKSVSALWDWEKVYRVKTQAYYELISWHREYFPKDVKAVGGGVYSPSLMS